MKEITITEQTRVPLGLVKVIVGAVFTVLCFCVGGAWWAATVSEKLTVIRSEQVKITDDTNMAKQEMVALQVAVDRIINSGTDIDKSQNRQLLELISRINELERRIKPNP